MNTKRIVVGFMGCKGSGKDTAAAMLRHLACQTMPVHRRAHGDAIKVAVAAKMGITVEQLERDKEIHRTELQDFGVQRYQENPRHWIDKLDLPATGLVTITDIRRKNEIENVTALGGIMVRVVNGRAEERAASDLHVTEREWNSFTTGWHLYNNWSLAELESEVRTLWLWMQDAYHIRP